MKKILAVLLMIVLLFSVASGFALAQEISSKILVDGVKDEAYTRWKMLDHSYWTYYYQETQEPMEPWEEERVKNTLWFDWDENYVYLYFQAQNHPQCGGPLYTPSENETTPPTDGTFYERVLICLDTAPSISYKAHCMLPHDSVPEEDECDHFCCNTVTGAGASHRLMATFVPAWNECTSYGSTEEWEGVSFIDYETNTYGVELKYPRLDNEEYFQINVVNYVNAKDDWDVDAPELGYTQSFCGTPRTNVGELLEIYYGEYPTDPTSEDYIAAQPIIELLHTLPSSLTLEDKAFLEQCRQTFNQLTPTQKSLVTNYEKLENAEYTMEILNVEWLISQFSQQLTQENKHFVTKANEAYNALTNSQKSAVKNRQNLTDALEEKRSLDIVEEVENLPEILTKQDMETVEDLWQRYHWLSDKQRTKVTNYATLETAIKTTKNLYSVKYGDVDENGSVNAKDALLALKYSVGKTSLFTNPKLAAEVDREVGINAKDALLILKYAVGKIQEFPVEIAR